MALKLSEMTLSGSGKLLNLKRVQHVIDEIQKEPIKTSDEAILWECFHEFGCEEDEFIVIRYRGKIYLVTRWYEAENAENEEEFLNH